MQRGARKRVLALVAVLLSGAACGLPDWRENEARVIRISAKKFAYTPARIELRKGQRVTLELVSLDRLHGFTVPGLGLRADVLPGQPVQVILTPGRSGRYVFLCDIFCGAGHGEMNGVIVVRD